MYQFVAYTKDIYMYLHEKFYRLSWLDSEYKMDILVIVSSIVARFFIIYIHAIVFSLYICMFNAPFNFDEYDFAWFPDRTHLLYSMTRQTKILLNIKI